MRITEELRNRINRQLELKYHDERANIEKAFKTRVEAEKPAVLKELNSLVSTKLGNLLFAKVSYRELTPEQYLDNNNSTFFPEAYLEYNKACANISEQKKSDYEELAIQVSYQKDIEGIKSAFMAIGLTF